jgi:hypothetical protein
MHRETDRGRPHDALVARRAKLIIDTRNICARSVLSGDNIGKA